MAAQVRLTAAPSRTVWSVLVPRSMMSGGTVDHRKLKIKRVKLKVVYNSLRLSLFRAP